MKPPVLLGLTVLLALPLCSAAQAYCLEPSSEPWCLSDDNSFRDSNSFDDCRWQVERFVDEIEDYVDCLESEKDDDRREISDLKDEIDDLFSEIEEKEDAQEEAVDRANEVVRRFNCGSSSGEACW